MTEATAVHKKNIAAHLKFAKEHLGVPKYSVDRLN
jgi:hypothetical protein